MQPSLKLFYVILGGTPEGRNIEQHDVFFGIAENIKQLVPEMRAFWPGVKLHIDCWKTVGFADGYEVRIKEKRPETSGKKLYFVNLGGYKPNFFEEFHEQKIFVADSMGDAVKQAKQSDFYKNMGFPGAVSHIDDKHGVDVDDIHEISEILPPSMKEKYSVSLEKSDKVISEEMQIGYINLDKLLSGNQC